jgi:predicted glycosyltransferase
MSNPPRILFYVQHLLGIGHLARASRIANALHQRGAAITMVTGGLPVAGFPPPGLKTIALPALQSAGEGFSGLADAQGDPVDDAYLDRRRDRLLQVFHALDPDLVITEAFPFGRRQMRFELLPLLAAIAASRPRPRLCCSVRDILQAQKKPGRDAETLALLRNNFDRVLVHGDPDFCRLEDSFPLAGEIADRVVYTGLVAPERPTPATEGFDIVVSAGGGAVGGDLVRASIAALAHLPANLRMCLITGPNLPAASIAEIDAKSARLPAGRLKVERFRTDFPALLAASRLSVSQAGYNTVCDILQAGCRAVLIPYARGGETEQTERAQRLAACGRARVIDEPALDGPGLASAINAVLKDPAPADPTGVGTAPSPQLNGANVSARILYGLALGARKANAVSDHLSTPAASAPDIKALRP